MANKLYEETNIQAIANAIRSKGQTGTMTVAQMPSKIASIETGGVVTDYAFSVSNSQIEKFVDEVTYTSDYSTSSVSGYTSHSDSGRPNGQTIPNGGTLRLNNVGRFNEQTNGGKIYNIQPNTIGTYEVVNGDSIKSSGKLTVSGGVRVIYGSSFVNMRDIGGWGIAGQTTELYTYKVKYGLLYRGREMDDQSATPISVADKNMLTNLLGIRSELDMRETTEGGGNSVFNDYINLPIANYGDIFNSATTKEQFRLAAEFVMKHAIVGKPIYYHCAAGADRTGTMTWLLLALLGVSRSDCDKEYEITNFSGPERLRSTYLGALYNRVMSLGEDTFYGNILKAFQSFGVDIQLVNQFRHAMIDGEINDVEYPEFVPQTETVANLKACTRMSIENTSGAWGASFVGNDNGGLVLATSTPNDYQFADRESGNFYFIPVPNWATKCAVTTTDQSVKYYKWGLWQGTAANLDKLRYEPYTQGNNVLEFSAAENMIIGITPAYSTDGSVKPAWGYDSSKFTVTFTNY